MTNVLEKAEQALWDSQPVIERDLELAFKSLAAKFNLEDGFISKDEYSQWLDEELQHHFRRSCEDILESKDIECEIDDLDEIFSLQGDIISKLTVDLLNLIEQKVDATLVKAKEAGLLCETLQDQVADLSNHTCIDIDIDIDMRDELEAVITTDSGDQITMTTPEEVLEHHILISGNGIFKNRTLKKLDLMLQLTSIRKPELISAVRYHFQSGATVSEAARHCNLDYPSSLSNALTTLKKVEPIVDAISQLQDTKVF